MKFTKDRTMIKLTEAKPLPKKVKMPSEVMIETVVSKRGNFCPICSGRGEVRDKHTRLMRMCVACKGTGMIKLKNL